MACDVITHPVESPVWCEPLVHGHDFGKCQSERVDDEIRPVLDDKHVESPQAALGLTHLLFYKRVHLG